MVEATEQQATVIARWFNVSPAMLGIKGSVSYNSKEQDQQAFLDHTLRRWLNKLQSECRLKLLTDQSRRTQFFTHDTEALLSMDLLKMAQSWQVLRQMQVLSANEVRSKMGLKKYEGGDKYDNPVTASSDTTTPKNSPPPKKDSPQRSEAGWQEKRVLFNLTSAARHKAKKPAAFLEWIDGDLKVHRDEWRTLTNGATAPEFFVSIRENFKQIADSVTATELPAAIDQIATNFERTM